MKARKREINTDKYSTLPLPFLRLNFGMYDIDYDNIDYSTLDETALKRSRYILTELVYGNLSEPLTRQAQEWLCCCLATGRKETEVALWEMSKGRVVLDKFGHTRKENIAMFEEFKEKTGWPRSADKKIT